MDPSMLKRQREEADATHCSWAAQVLQDEASELTAIAKHLETREAKSGVAPAPFTGWVVQHDCVAPAPFTRWARAGDVETATRGG